MTEPRVATIAVQLPDGRIATGTVPVSEAGSDGHVTIRSDDVIRFLMQHGHVEPVEGVVTLPECEIIF